MSSGSTEPPCDALAAARLTARAMLADVVRDHDEFGLKRISPDALADCIADEVARQIWRWPR